MKMMRQIIQENKVRPQAGEPATLENAINVDHFPEGGWGVGKISTLNAEAPYWRVINYGGYVPPSTRNYPNLKGKFEPGEERPDPSNFRAGRFKKGYYPIDPKKAIPAMNYIEKTSFWVEKELNRLIPGIIRRIK